MMLTRPSILRLTFVLLHSARIVEAAVRADELSPRPDITAELTERSMAAKHARYIEGFLSLPRHHITRVETHADDMFFRALLHVHEPGTRFMLDCPRRGFAGGCMLLSPYVYQQADAEGKITSEKVIMTLFAKKHRFVEPVALVHLPQGDQMDVWEWVKQVAEHSKQDLEAHQPHGLFIFPELPDF
ncbi:hypothetical protein EX895_003062 [Sporisorium graminicola]|uniref:Uncharacterized protein n=1 Tax=Sporisorium graminicola TaxID=280036 RepID=A0A4U7KUY4_9BASI|nr:hypothetical protein EX895_003062 [Sporisorium graminicola]TKY87966.1 hypothetical protein EX895_003062 [Sporisorium graminicola]